MTAATSGKRPNYFGKRFAYGITENRKLLIINFLLSLLGLPVAVSLIIYIGWNVANGDVEKINNAFVLFFPFISISCVFAVIAGFLGVVSALFSFSYLFRKTDVDMNYSLPLTNTQRFFADYLSGLAVYLVPNIISIVIAVVITKFGEKYFQYHSELSVLSEGIRFFAILIMSALLFYSICVFAITMCGSMFEAIFSVASYIIIVPALIFSVWTSICYYYDFRIAYSSYEDSLIFLSSGLIGNIEYIYDYFNYLFTFPTNVQSMYQFKEWLMLTGLFFVLHTLGAYVFYVRRKAEDVSKPYVYKSFFYVIMTIALLGIIALSKDAFMSEIPGIIVGAVLWLIMEVITRRGFKRIWTAVVGFAVAISLSLFVSCVVLKPIGKTLASTVPNASDLAAVKVENTKFFGETELYFTDTDVIKSVIALHQQIVDIKNDPDSYFEYESEKYDKYNDYSMLNLKYYTKHGKTISRNYSIPTELESDLIAKIMLSDEYPDIYVQNLAGAASKVDDTYELSVANRIGYKKRYMTLDANQYNEFKAAIKSDLNEMTADDLAHLSDVKYILSEKICVYDFFSNTIAFIEERFPNIGEIEADDIQENKIVVTAYPDIYFYNSEFYYDNSRYYTSQIFIDSSTYELGENENKSKVKKINVSNEESKRLNGSRYIDVNDAGSIELIRQFTPSIYDEHPIAVINLDRLYFLPDTDVNRELLEKYTKNKEIISGDVY